MNKLHDVVQILKAAGWKNNCDAQWSGIEAALPELAALLSCNSPAQPVARDVLMAFGKEVADEISRCLPYPGRADISTIADRYATQPPAVAVPDGYALVPIEPTREMFKAVDKLDDEMFAGGCAHGANFEQLWEAAILAAPKP